MWGVAAARVGRLCTRARWAARARHGGAVAAAAAAQKKEARPVCTAPRRGLRPARTCLPGRAPRTLSSLSMITSTSSVDAAAADMVCATREREAAARQRGRGVQSRKRCRRSRERRRRCCARQERPVKWPATPVRALVEPRAGASQCRVARGLAGTAELRGGVADGATNSAFPGGALSFMLVPSLATCSSKPLEQHKRQQRLY